MHPTDIAQQRLIDAACKVEAEIRILSQTHVGKILMRHRLQNSTRYFGNTALRVVSVPEFPHLPTAIFPLHLLGYC